MVAFEIYVNAYETTHNFAFNNVRETSNDIAFYRHEIIAYCSHDEIMK